MVWLEKKAASALVLLKSAADRRQARRPATCGALMLVPVIDAYVAFARLLAETICSPGAIRSTHGPWLEKAEK